jgi:hypothetical protein
VHIDLVPAYFKDKSVHGTDLSIARIVCSLQSRFSVLESLLDLVSPNHPHMAHTSHQCAKNPRKTLLDSGNVGHNLNCLVNGSFIKEILAILHSDSSYRYACL